MVEVISALAGHVESGRHGVERKGAGVIFRDVPGRTSCPEPATMASNRGMNPILRRCAART